MNQKGLNSGVSKGRKNTFLACANTFYENKNTLGGAPFMKDPLHLGLDV